MPVLANRHNAYLTYTEFLQRSGGEDQSPFRGVPQPVVDAKLLDGSRMVDAWCAVKTWDYQEITDEQRPFSGSLRFFTKALPIRKINRIIIASSYGGGHASGPTIGAEDVQLDHDQGTGQAVSLTLSMAMGQLFAFFIEPYLSIDYTAGFDGTHIDPDTGLIVADPRVTDGLMNPYPDTLQSATYYTAEALLGEWLNSRRGMVGLERVTVGPISYQRPRRTHSADEVAIPSEARDLLQGFWSQAKIAVGGV